MNDSFDKFFCNLKQFAPKGSGETDFLQPAEVDKSDTEGQDGMTGDMPFLGEYRGEVPAAVPFARHPDDEKHPVAAVDAGVMRLMESAEGIVVALRAAIVINEGARMMTRIVRSGPIFLAWEHEVQILEMLGTFLDDPSYYVIPAFEEAGTLHPAILKNGVGGRLHIADRFRAGLERYCQRLAATSVKRGTLLLDGSLTLRSRDTPDTYLNQIAFLAGRNGNSIVALSKKSELIVGGKAVSYWLDDLPATPSYRALTPILQWEDAQSPSGRGGRAKRVLGNVYAVRLSPLAPTLRMDVKAAPGLSDDAAIDAFYCSGSIYCGYPNLLARAHAACYMSSADFIALQTQATRDLRLQPRRQTGSLSGAFAPFGGSYK